MLREIKSKEGKAIAIAFLGFLKKIRLADDNTIALTILKIAFHELDVKWKVVP